MSLTVNVNNLSLCHKGSNGISTATIPDVCKTPSPGGPVPIPYPNIAMSMDLMKGTTTVKADGGMMCANYGSEFFKSTGDEPGVAGGVVSSTFIKEATWITFSFNVKLQGKAACRLTDKMFHNHQNTVNMAGLIQAPLATSPTDKKANCYACQKELIEDGKNSDDPKVRDAANRLGRMQKDYEHALLSQHVYDPSKPPPPGWTPVSKEEDLAKYGLKPSDLSKPPSEFRAQMYEPDPKVFGNDMQPTVAFKGTSFDSLEDWKNNGAQGIGVHSDYYNNAVAIGNKLEGQNVNVTGHSLGGGLASAAGSSGGLNGSTFNAAGLKGGTVGDYGGTPKPSDINAYRVEGEILTNLQEFSVGGSVAAAGVGGLLGGLVGGAAGLLAGGVGAIPGAIGGAIAGAKLALKAKTILSMLMPNAVGTPYEVPGTGLDPVDRHSMDQVIAGMKKQMGEDQAVLEKALGRKCDC
jgi:hypothetical protein